MTEQLYRQTVWVANTTEPGMRTLFLSMCAAAGWWVSRDDGLACEIGVAIVTTGLGLMVVILATIIRPLSTGHQPTRRTSCRPWGQNRATGSEFSSPMEWVPVLDSPEDPFHNPHHSPEHQNAIDPDQWI